MNQRMEESGNDHLVAQFLAVTGSSDTSKASSYLEMGGNNVELAVGLFMENEQGPSSFGGGGGGASADAAGLGGGATMPGMDDDIRAPDATQTMRLMDDGSGGGMMMMPGMLPNDPSLHMMQAMMNEQLNRPTAFSSLDPDTRGSARDTLNALVAQQGADPNNMFADEGSDDIQVVGDSKEEESDENTAGKGPARLSDMFSPPIEIMHSAGGFAGARAMAKDTKRWLLVNIQRDEEFASHALNRDVWRDELVENLIRSGFIFWQQMDSHPDGRTYVERYRVESFPHIAILDPRTGRLLWSKAGWTLEDPVTPASFAQMAMDFCSRNSFDRPPQAPKPGVAKSTGKRPVHDMSEEEQMEAAMRESLKANSQMDEDSIHGSESIAYDSDVEVEDAKPPPAEEKAKPASMIDDLLNVAVGDEDSGGSRIQLKTPDGKRAVRKFSPSSAVRIIYAFFAQNNEEARGGREFVLMAGYPMRDLSLEMDSTIEEAQLKNEAITVRWK